VVEHSEYQQRREENSQNQAADPFQSGIGAKHEIRYGWEVKDEPPIGKIPGHKMIPNQPSHKTDAASEGYNCRAL